MAATRVVCQDGESQRPCRAPGMALAQLLAAAASLTGPALVLAETSDAHPTSISYRVSDYDEDALSPAPVDGSGQRYHVSKQQFDLRRTLDETDSLRVGVTREVMSGSSPWFNVPGDDGKPLQVMSGATIHDERHEVSAAWTHIGAQGSSLSVSASYSGEDDYRSSALGLEREQRMSDAWTLGYGASFSHDAIDPSQAAQYGRIDHASKNTASLFASLARVLDRDSVLQGGLQLTQSNGYLSDPYKLFYAGGPTLADTRPDQRTQAAVLLRYRRALIAADAALHLDYRYAQDSWGTSSHTLDLAWYQSLGQDWKLIPSLRYYSQDDARFYAAYSRSRSTAGRFHSSDYRLSAYGAWSAGLDVRKAFGAIELVFGIERYRSDADASLGGGSAAPGLVRYNQAFAGFDYRLD